MRNLNWKWLVVLSMILLSIIVIWPGDPVSKYVPFLSLEFKPQLGLDIAGGIHIVLEAVDTPEVKVEEADVKAVEQVLRSRVDALGLTEPNIYRLGGESWRKIIVELPYEEVGGIKDPAEAIQLIGKTALLEFKAEDGTVLITGKYLRTARSTTDEMGSPAVGFEFDEARARADGQKTFEEITSEHLNKTISIVLDGEVISSPRVESVITGGEGIIKGDFTFDEAARLSALLRGGALPVKVEIAETRFLGPTLGYDYLREVELAGVVAFILVASFMVFKYKHMSIVSMFSLSTFLLFLLAILLSLRATLTLPGIAGIVLSLGMAVDGSIIVFERIREEVMQGRNVRTAVNNGYKKAFSTIFDSNVTTLIGTLVLYQFGTGPIRGFAVTLSIGVLVGLFVTLFVSRLLTEAIGIKYLVPRTFKVRRQ
ncbi:MAG: hypothetical protein DDT41_00377 [candidate division WS2 bacterium]|nr:hypothetical protein [Candidatus Psychracetigena formicireducens]